MKILTVIGARPQFVKSAVVSKALLNHKIPEYIIHTGQHYDPNMSDVFWKELQIPEPYINLNIGSGSHAVQTASMMTAIEQEISKVNPDAVLLYGDTNSTLAGALVASKMNTKIIHVEAGLRSFNTAMPEEINRVLTDHVSDYLFCSSEEGVKQLKNEGIRGSVYNVGDVMYDAVLQFSPLAESQNRWQTLLPFKNQPYILATIHRPSNTDAPENLSAILSAFGKLDIQVIWPLHPRNNEKIAQHSVPPNVHIIPPASYFEMLSLLRHCVKVCTDSGGLQKEAYWLKKPCITLRCETEWVECMHNDWNILAGNDTEKIVSAVKQEVDTATWFPLYGDGHAGEAIVQILKESLP